MSDILNGFVLVIGIKALATHAFEMSLEAQQPSREQEVGIAIEMLKYLSWLFVLVD